MYKLHYLTLSSSETKIELTIVTRGRLKKNWIWIDLISTFLYYWEASFEFVATIKIKSCRPLVRRNFISFYFALNVWVCLCFYAVLSLPNVRIKKNGYLKLLKEIKDSNILSITGILGAGSAGYL